MYKRGQFFLIAGLIIISIILGFGVVYNVANTPKSDTKLPALAKEIKYEAVQTIDNAVYKSTTADGDNNIKINLQSLGKFYSTSHSDIDFVIICERKNKKFFGLYFSREQRQNGIDFSNNITENKENGNDIKYITINFAGQNYIFNNLDGRDVFVIVDKENENEKYIATA